MHTHHAIDYIEFTVRDMAARRGSTPPPSVGPPTMGPATQGVRVVIGCEAPQRGRLWTA